MSSTDGRPTTSGTSPDEGDIAEVIALAGRRRRPAPVTEEWDWQMQAACRDLDSAVFFNPLGERGHEKLRRELHAQRPPPGPCRGLTRHPAATRGVICGRGSPASCARKES